MNYHKRPIENAKEQSFVSRNLTELTDVPMCLSQPNHNGDQTRTLSKNNVSDPQARKPSKAASCGKRPSRASMEFSIGNENRQDLGVHRQSVSSMAVNSSTVEEDVRCNDSYQLGFDDVINQSSELDEDVHNDIYLEKRNSLSLKVNQQLSLIKEPMKSNIYVRQP